jgi:hypothetical protein
MIWIFLIFAFVYLFVIVLSDDPRTYFPRLARKLTPEQEQFLEKLRQWIEYLHVGAFLLLLYAIWTLWLAYKYFGWKPADPP